MQNIFIINLGQDTDDDISETDSLLLSEESANDSSNISGVEQWLILCQSQTL